MNGALALRKLRETRSAVVRIMQNMEDSKRPEYVPLLNRGRLLVSDLDYQIANIQNQVRNENGTLGFAFLAAAPWAYSAGAAALALAGAWIADSWGETARIKARQENIARYGPERAAQIEAESKTGVAGSLASLNQIVKIIAMVIGGFLVLRVIA